MSNLHLDRVRAMKLPGRSSAAPLFTKEIINEERIIRRQARKY